MTDIARPALAEKTSGRALPAAAGCENHPNSGAAMRSTGVVDGAGAPSSAGYPARVARDVPVEPRRACSRARFRISISARCCSAAPAFGGALRA